MIVSLIIVNNKIHEIKKNPNKHITNNMCAIYIQESNQQYLSIEIYIHTANNGTLLFLFIFAKLYSKQTKITFNIPCFEISIGNFHLIFVV